MESGDGSKGLDRTFEWKQRAVSDTGESSATTLKACRMVFPALSTGKELSDSLLSSLKMDAHKEALRAQKNPESAYNKATGFLPSDVFSMMLVMIAACQDIWREKVCCCLQQLC